MITLYFGPMFSGKTTMLLEQEHMYHISKKQVLFIKYKLDTRYTTENKIISHTGQQSKCESTVIATDSLVGIVECIKQYDVILIDEGQFYKDMIVFVRTLQQQKINKPIYISGLSGDFKQEPFQVISELIPLCEKIVHLQSVCHKCTKPASFTIRTTKDLQQELIGDSQIYLPSCGECLHE